MNSRNKKKEETYDYSAAALDRLTKKSVDTVESLAKKVQGNKDFKYKSWIDEIVVPEGTIASSLDPAICVMRLEGMKKKIMGDMHCVHTFESIVENSDVKVGPTSITAQVDGKDVEYPVKYALLLPAPNSTLTIVAGVTSTLVASQVRNNDKKGFAPIDQKTLVTGVPQIDAAITVRTILKDKTTHGNACKNFIFKELVKPSARVWNLKLHSMIGNDLSNYVHNAQLTQLVREDYQANGDVVPDELDIKVVSIGRRPLKVTSKLIDAYKFHETSIGVRGESKSVFCGFERFEMSRVISETLNFVQDCYNLCGVAKTKTIILTNSNDMSREVIRVLVKNGFSIVIENSVYPEQDVEVPGVYSSSKDKTAIRYIAFSPEDIKPSYVKGSFSWGKKVPEVIRRLSGFDRVFAHVYLDARYNNKTLLLFPSATADTMMCIVANIGNRKESYTLEQLTRRAVMADSCKNNFGVDRRTFMTVDTMADFVNWDRIIVYPRTRSTVIKKGLTLQDLDVEGNSEMLKMPSLVLNPNEFASVVTKVTQTESQLTKILRKNIDRRDFAAAVGARYFDKMNYKVKFPRDVKWLDELFEEEPHKRIVYDAVAKLDVQVSDMLGAVFESYEDAKDVRKEEKRRSSNVSNDESESEEDTGLVIEDDPTEADLARGELYANVEI